MKMSSEIHINYFMHVFDFSTCRLLIICNFSWWNSNSFGLKAILLESILRITYELEFHQSKYQDKRYRFMKVKIKNKLKTKQNYILNTYGMPCSRSNGAGIGIGCTCILWCGWGGRGCDPSRVEADVTQFWHLVINLLYRKIKQNIYIYHNKQKVLLY